jgi:hypothetical protein
MNSGTVQCAGSVHQSAKAFTSYNEGTVQSLVV